MKITIIVLLLIILIMVTGGLWFYLKIFKNIAKEFKEFVQVTFEALKDRKLTYAEKQAMLKEWSDIKPYTKQLKNKFVDDVKDLADEVKETYQEIGKQIKKK